MSSPRRLSYDEFYESHVDDSRSAASSHRAALLEERASLEDCDPSDLGFGDHELGLSAIESRILELDLELAS